MKAYLEPSPDGLWVRRPFRLFYPIFGSRARAVFLCPHKGSFALHTSNLLRWRRFPALPIAFGGSSAVESWLVNWRRDTHTWARCEISAWIPPPTRLSRLPLRPNPDFPRVPARTYAHPAHAHAHTHAQKRERAASKAPFSML
ncbi:hypothetical protein L1887_63111 [Cichorium endivia]|nr:hypothetical protein L1887_63111 [Cichorium endivia]